jgi:hypothetical protein
MKQSTPVKTPKAPLTIVTATPAKPPKAKAVPAPTPDRAA